MRMERIGKEILIAIIAGLIVAALWGVIGISATHGGWSWGSFFGHSASIAIPVGTWKVLGTTGVLIAIGVIIAVVVLELMVALMLAPLLLA
jgi:hypothetical protein